MNSTLGIRFRNLREDSDLNQTQLDEKLHMKQRKVSYIEYRKYEPSI